MRSYESLTFASTPKLTQPVSCTVAWQAAGDDDVFSSGLKSFLEFPIHGWSFHLYAYNESEGETGQRFFPKVMDDFNVGFVHLLLDFTHILIAGLSNVFDRILSKGPIWR